MISIKKAITCNTFPGIEKNIAVFKALIDINQNIAIKVPFRFTKRSLIKSVFEHIGSYNYIYADMRDMTDLKLLSNNILTELEKINVDKIPFAMIEASRNCTNETDQFLYTLDIVEKVAENKNINIKFVFDEFQDILNNSNKRLIDQCRSVIQHHENITYIFIGSNEVVMTNIFEKYASSFFHFAKVMSFNKDDLKKMRELLF